MNEKHSGAFITLKLATDTGRRAIRIESIAAFRETPDGGTEILVADIGWAKIQDTFEEFSKLLIQGGAR